MLAANEDTAQYLLAFQELLESEGNGNNGQGSKSGGEEEKEEERIEQYFEKSRSLIIARSLTMSDARLHYRLGERMVLMLIEMRCRINHS